MIGDSVDAEFTGAASVGILSHSSADGMMASSVVAKTSPGFGRDHQLLYRPHVQAAKHPRLFGSKDTGSRLEGGHAREMT